MAPEERWVGVEDVANHLQVAKESIYRWIDSKGFPAHRVGRLLRFKISEVDKWVTTGSESASGSGPLGKTTESRSAGRKSRSQKKRGD